VIILRLIALALIAAPAAAQSIQKLTLADGVERWIAAAGVDEKPAFFRRFEEITGLRLPAATDLPFGRSVAFLIGVGKYPNFSNAEQLPYVQGDVDALRDYLIGEGGFDEVLVVRDEKATPELVERYMMSYLPKNMDRQDRLLFYFSGHGSDAGGAVGYLLLSGSKKGEFWHSAVAISRVQEWSRILPVDHALFLFDSCSSGLGITAKGAEFDSDRQLLATLSRNGSRFAITAGTAEESTFEVDDGQGQGGEVFTRSLLAALQSYSGQGGPYSSLLTLSQVFAEVERNVKQWAALKRVNITPKPWPLDPTNASRGSFIFLNARSSGPVADDLARALKAETSRPDTAPPASWRDLAVSFDGAAKKGERLVLAGGPVAAGTRREYNFRVQNLTARPIRLELQVDGHGVEASWDGGLWSRLVDPYAIADLKVRVAVAELSAADHIWLLSGGRQLVSMQFDFQARPASLTREAASGPRLSGETDSWSAPYSHCLGPVPAGYTLDVSSAEYSLSGDRRCGQWAQCRWLRRDDQNVCFEFLLQGHNELPARFDRGGARESEGHLRASYSLVAKPPRLEVSPN
jgi:hypothetical protein